LTSFTYFRDTFTKTK